jgi:hypothetical protein
MKNTFVAQFTNFFFFIANVGKVTTKQKKRATGQEVDIFVCVIIY